jgi:hypothetical protein
MPRRGYRIQSGVSYLFSVLSESSSSSSSSFVLAIFCVGRAESRPLFVSLALPHANRCDQPRKQSVFRSWHPENGEDDDDDDDEEDWEITLHRYGVSTP